MLDLGDDDRVTGLRLQGYDLTDTTARSDGTDGIRVDGATGVLIDNDEISGWPDSGVDVGPNVAAANGRVGGVQARITNDYIHDNVQCGFGYGVSVGEDNGNAFIDRNVFDHNRHDVAGGHSSPHVRYVAELNLVLTSGPTCDGNYNQHFDMHGSDDPGHWNGGAAGNRIEIRENTIRGAQSYGFLGRKTRPAFELRGIPTDQAIFADNAVAHDGEGSAIQVAGVAPLAGGLLYLERTGKLVVSGNRWNVDTSTRLAVGDFDGDGCSDLFQSVGTVWVYSPCGKRAWRFLNQSTIGLDRLAFGDFDGDGKTDVFTQDGSQWLVSYGGTGRGRRSRRPRTSR